MKQSSIVCDNCGKNLREEVSPPLKKQIYVKELHLLLPEPSEGIYASILREKDFCDRLCLASYLSKIEQGAIKP